MVLPNKIQVVSLSLLFSLICLLVPCPWPHPLLQFSPTFLLAPGFQMARMGPLRRKQQVQCPRAPTESCLFDDWVLLADSSRMVLVLCILFFGLMCSEELARPQIRYPPYFKVDYLQLFEYFYQFFKQVEIML